MHYCAPPRTVGGGALRVSGTPWALRVYIENIGITKPLNLFHWIDDIRRFSDLSLSM